MIYNNLSFNIAIICMILMIVSSSIYLFMYPFSIIDFSSPFLQFAFINAVIGIIICIKEIISDIIEGKKK